MRIVAGWTAATQELGPKSVASFHVLLARRDSVGNIFGEKIPPIAPCGMLPLVRVSAQRNASNHDRRRDRFLSERSPRQIFFRQSRREKTEGGTEDEHE